MAKTAENNENADGRKRPKQLNRMGAVRKWSKRPKTIKMQPSESGQNVQK